MRSGSLARSGLLLAALALGPSFTPGARAQDAGSDAGQLPVYRGRVQLFTLTPRGDIDGFVLTDGTEVKTPPHLSTQVALTIRPGDDVTIHGLKAAKLPLIQAVILTNDRDGKSVEDRGAGDPPFGETEANVETRPIGGQIRMVLHGPRGDADGVLLDDGTIVKLPPPEFDRFATLLSPGRTIAAEGRIRVTAAGTVVEATTLGASPQSRRPVE